MSNGKFEKGDKVIEYAQSALTSVLSEGTAADIIRRNLVALGKQAKALEQASYGEKEKSIACPECGNKFKIFLPVPFDQVAKAMAYTTKTVDEMARLLSFVKGGPDSRPDLGIGALLEALTDDQLYQVQEWVAENRTKAQ